MSLWATRGGYPGAVRQSIPSHCESCCGGPRPVMSALSCGSCCSALLLCCGLRLQDPRRPPRRRRHDAGAARLRAVRARSASPSRSRADTLRLRDAARPDDGPMQGTRARRRQLAALLRELSAADRAESRRVAARNDVRPIERHAQGSATRTRLLPGGGGAREHHFTRRGRRLLSDFRGRRARHQDLDVEVLDPRANASRSTPATIAGPSSSRTARSASSSRAPTGAACGPSAEPEVRHRNLAFALELTPVACGGAASGSEAFKNYDYPACNPLSYDDRTNRELGERRKRVLEALGTAVMVLPSAPLAIRNNDVEHEYRQDSDLFYLTGFDEPESAGRCCGAASTSRSASSCGPRDPEREVWDGKRCRRRRRDEADFGADEAFTIAELATKLPELFENSRAPLLSPRARSRLRRRRALAPIDRVRARAKLGIVLARRRSSIPATIVHEMRRVKSDERARPCVRRAVEITREAHRRAMAHGASPACLRVRGRRGHRRDVSQARLGAPAYGSIVGSGPNATVLHYRKNDRQHARRRSALDRCRLRVRLLRVRRHAHVPGERHASAPHSARSTRSCSTAQVASIAATRAGRDPRGGPQRERGGDRAGPRRPRPRSRVRWSVVLEKQSYKPFYMHRTSHWLGMDVHDVGALLRRRQRPAPPRHRHGDHGRAGHLRRARMPKASPTSTAASASASRTTCSSRRRARACSRPRFRRPSTTSNAPAALNGWPCRAVLCVAGPH